MTKIKISITYEMEHEINFEHYPAGIKTVEQVIEFEKEQVCEHAHGMEWDKAVVQIEEIK